MNLHTDERSLSDLDKVLKDKHGNLRPVSASTLHEISYPLLQTYAHFRAIYTFPTRELLGWLRRAIGTDTAIEICAGHGSIGRALEIPTTDSYMQDRPEVQLIYQLQRHPTTKPPSDVKKMEALEAVEYFKPHTVIGAFATQLFRDDGIEQASAYGVDEEILLSKVKRYIFIGNENVHGQKRILARPHETIRAPWIVTRANDPTKNVIWVFTP